MQTQLSATLFFFAFVEIIILYAVKHDSSVCLCFISLGSVLLVLQEGHLYER